MMNTLKRVVRPLKKSIRSFKWSFQAYRIGRLYKEVCKPQKIAIEKDANVLVVAPHPDDELIGCFGIIGLQDCNIDIYYTGLTGYDISTENRSIRLNELKKLCDFYKINLVSDIPGQHIQFSDLIYSKQYNYIFLPTYIDWHWEHRSTSKQLLKILMEQGYSGDLLWYMVSVPIPIKVFNCYSLVGIKKWMLFKRIYQSQHHMPVDRFKAIETIYIDKKRVEPYLLFHGNQLNKLYYSLSNLDVDHFNAMEKSINELPLIMMEAEKAYKLLFEEMNRNEII